MARFRLGALSFSADALSKAGAVLFGAIARYHSSLRREVQFRRSVLGVVRIFIVIVHAHKPITISPRACDYSWVYFLSRGADRVLRDDGRALRLPWGIIRRTCRTSWVLP